MKSEIQLSLIRAYTYTHVYTQICTLNLFLSLSLENDWKKKQCYVKQMVEENLSILNASTVLCLTFFSFCPLQKNICIVQKSYLNFQINANYIVLNTNNTALFTYVIYIYLLQIDVTCICE